MAQILMGRGRAAASRLRRPARGLRLGALRSMGGGCLSRRLPISLKASLKAAVTGMGWRTRCFPSWWPMSRSRRCGSGDRAWRS